MVPSWGLYTFPVFELVVHCTPVTWAGRSLRTQLIECVSIVKTFAVVGVIVAAVRKGHV